jgi:hypothetical protein
MGESINDGMTKGRERREGNKGTKEGQGMAIEKK